MRAVCSRPVTRPVASVLLALTLLLGIFPLTLGKPGMPAALKSDEPAYYLAALSLARDHDLRLDLHDVDRAFREFPFRRIDNLILMTDDGWQTVLFGKPYLYSLFAAPFAGLFGANGMLCFNLLMLCGMVWLGSIYLARFNPPWLAALFSAGFFLLSNGFAYAFWLHPEVFSMAAVTASLFLGFHRWGEGEGRESGSLALAASGAALALAAYNKPMLAGLGLVFAVRYARRKDLRRLGAWLGGAVVTMAAVAGLAILLTGHPTSYLGVRRQGVTLCEPGKLPIGPEAPKSAPAAPAPVAAGAAAGPIEPSPPPSASEAPTGTGGAWSWIFTLPTIRPLEFRDNLVYFFFGRHAGLFLYSPFAALALWLFVFYERRSFERWLLLLSAAGIGFFFLAYIPANWQGGGGFVGNRYFILAYPAFLFLVTRIAPPAIAVVGFALGSLFLGPILLTPFGAGGPEPTLQSHVRNVPFRYFPLEQTLREVPGYLRADIGEAQFTGRRDVFLPQGDALWLRGASESELWIASLRPYARFAFDVRSLAPRNRIELNLAGRSEVLEYGEVPPEGEVKRVVLEVAAPTKVRGTRETPLYLYRFDVKPADGRIRPWTRLFPPDYCPYFAANESFEESFFVGAMLTFLGDADDLGRDVYRVDWGAVAPVSPLAPGSRIEIPLTLTNASREPWRHSGVARVRLAHRWLDAGGAVIAEVPQRVELPLPLAPTESASVALPVVAPASPGAYVVEVDLVFETVAWFSDRGAAKLRIPIEVSAVEVTAP